MTRDGHGPFGLIPSEELLQRHPWLVQYFITARAEMRCQSVAFVVVYGLLVSPADVQPLFLPRFKAIMQALQFPPCFWWCSGGLFKLLNRKIISPNKCDTQSRWLIIKRVSLFPFMLWLIYTCWGYTS